jgi:hypothetical protein
MNSKQIVLASRPKGMPAVENFRTEQSIVAALKEGEVLLSPLYISVDPYLRGRMNEEKSYIPPFVIDRPIESAVVAEVVESKSNSLQKGDKVTGLLPWATQFIEQADKLFKLEPANVPFSYYLGVLGYPGLTSYFGVMDICRPKAGETMVISGAAGAVGVIAGQIAKIQGCRVVGIVGSDEKAQLLKTEFGFDEVINYRTTKDMSAAIAAACPDGVDCYFDNVGGDITDAVIAHINFYARIALCGQIALYNEKEVPVGPRILLRILMRAALIKGFIITDYQARFAEGAQFLMQQLQEGRLKHQETIVEGFDKLPEAFLGLFSGSNTGKMLVKI